MVDMVLKSDIVKAFRAQQNLLKPYKTHISRAFLKNFQPNKKHIEVITGIRRCGKSTLMKQIMQRYYRSVAFFNFEDSRIFGFEVSDFSKLDETMPPKVEAYFFDEIQNVASWEIYIRQLHDRGAKIFITGYNASLLSKELGTRLTGRHLRHEMFPFSYAEFLLFKKLKKSEASVSEYLLKGGFPEYLAADNTDILQHLLKDIVLRDIAIRHHIRNTKTLMDMTLYLLSNIGKECSYNSLKKSFALGSANTAADYLAWLEDSYLLFFVPRFSWSAKSIAVNPRKVYAIDNGLVNANTLSFSDDKGRLLENAVYIHLRQRPYVLYYFRENKECDFVVLENRKCKMLIQVCHELNADNKMRETEGLLEAMKFFKLKEGTIVTFSQQDTLQADGYTIHLVPISDFLLADV
jgi:predicted AAA+ superfamily ATPase